MKYKVILVVVFSFLFVGCSNKTKTSAEIEQRELFDQSNRSAFDAGQDADQLGANDEELRAQQEELRRELEREEQRLLEEQARGQDNSEQIARSEVDAASIRDQLNEKGSLLAERSIFYEFDSSIIRAEYRPIVEAHGKFLATNPEVKVRLEGNCDDRGSREYNLSLGQSRADQLKEALVLLGANPAQIDVVSYGAERPVSFGVDEASRAKNRRSDIVYSY